MSAANDSSASLSSSASAESDVRTSAPMTTSSNSGDSCAWYAGGSCDSPRSCEDCLNVAISGDSCAIGSIGQCVSMSTATAGGAGSYYYPASSLTYCAATDATCAACRTEWVKEYTQDGYRHSASVCTGADGCICLAVCARPNREDLIVENYCSLFGNSSMRILVIMALVIGSLVAFALSSLCVRVAMRRNIQRQREQQRARREAQRAARRVSSIAGGRQLTLAGWTDMREKLIASENGRLNVESDAADADFKPQRTSLAPGVTFEEGEGYRPLSPSERHAQPAQPSQREL